MSLLLLVATLVVADDEALVFVGLVPFVVLHVLEVTVVLALLGDLLENAVRLLDDGYLMDVERARPLEF